MFLGAIQPLARLVDKEGSVVTQTLAIWALANLALSEGNIFSFFPFFFLFFFPYLLNNQIIIEATRTKMIEETTLAPKLAKVLKDADNEDLIEKILWLILNVTIDHPANRRALADEQLLPGFLPLFQLKPHTSASYMSMMGGSMKSNTLSYSKKIIKLAAKALTNMFYDGKFLFPFFFFFSIFFNKKGNFFENKQKKENAQLLFAAVPGGLQAIINLVNCTSRSISSAMVSLVLMLTAFSGILFLFFPYLL